MRRKLSIFCRELVKWQNLVIIAANIIFIFIEMKGWGNFDKITWGALDIDSLGHAVFGLMWGFILLYLIMIYLPESYISTPKFIIALIIVSVISAVLEVFFWEICVEWLLWDSWLRPVYFPLRAVAQKSALDTNLDIVVTMGGAVWAMVFWGTYRKWYAYKWPDAAEHEEIEEEKERGKIWARGIIAKRKDHRRQILKPFFANLRKKN